MSLTKRMLETTKNQIMFHEFLCLLVEVTHLPTNQPTTILTSFNKKHLKNFNKFLLFFSVLINFI